MMHSTQQNQRRRREQVAATARRAALARVNRASQQPAHETPSSPATGTQRGPVFLEEWVTEEYQRSVRERNAMPCSESGAV